MKGKYLVIVTLSIVFALVLSGCMNVITEIYHLPDGSGRYVVETIFTDEMLGLEEFEGLMMEDLQNDVVDLITSDLSNEWLENPNLQTTTRDSYIDPGTGSLHIINEAVVENILGQLPENTTIIANPDGTYRFSVEIDPSVSDADLVEIREEDEEEFEELRPYIEKSEFTYKLHVYEFIEGDPLARYDPDEKTVTWVIPAIDAFEPNFDINIWAVYRIEAAEEEVVPEIEITEPPIQEEPIAPVEVVETSDDGGFLGLPNWVPLVLGGLFCLTLIVVVVVVVVFVILKKRK